VLLAGILSQCARSHARREWGVLGGDLGRRGWGRGGLEEVGGVHRRGAWFSRGEMVYRGGFIGSRRVVLDGQQRRA
jgi:hypothetical protein